MRHRRIAEVTFRLLPVMIVALAALVPAAQAEEIPGPGPGDSERAIRRILGSGATDREKLAAADVLFERREVDDPESMVHAGLALLEGTPATGLWLLLRATDAAFLPDGLRTEARAHVQRLLAKVGQADATRSVWSAAAMLLEDRSEATRDILLATWPPAPAVRAVLARTLHVPENASAARRLLADLAPIQAALDEAARDDAEQMRLGLDRLLIFGERAVGLLVDEVTAASRGGPPGRWPRATRAATVLGLIGDRRATPALVLGLDAPDGWLQVASAAALGDLGDPAAAVPLAHKITYRGDVLRARDQWDFPGVKETNVSAEAWPTIDYYVVDVAVADALMRLGVARAIPWLIRKKMDPRRANFRIRVLQDAVDALARASSTAPVEAYEVDAGLPQRRAAFEGLMTWWHAQDERDGLLASRLDASDPGFRREARRMVERLRGRSIFQLQIAHETCALLGPAVTDSLLDVLASTKNAILQTEIARALGAVDDAKAIPALRGLMGERLGVVRATATESMGSYVDGRRDVEAALIARLEDPEPSVRVAAMRALVQAPPSAAVKRALDEHDVERHKATFGSADREYARAILVARLVQEGSTHFPPINRGLADERRYERVAWWHLLNKAMVVPILDYDPQPQPKKGQDGIGETDERRLLDALRTRRAP